MPRLPRDQEIKRRNAVRKLLDDGYDHNYIAEQMGMRPQNALALIRSLENTPEEEIVSNSRQRETLTTITEKVLDDLKDIDISTFIPGKIICVGMNYKSHIEEQDSRFPSRPVLFAKATSCVIKDGDYIIYPPEVRQLDVEV